MARTYIKDDVFLNVKPKDLLKQLSLKEQTVELDIEVPDNFFQTLLEQLHKWTHLLLDAAAAAGITREEAASLVLTEGNADAYIEWDGEELYPEDEVEVLSPAWYQNGKVLEQGQCRKVTAAEE